MIDIDEHSGFCFGVTRAITTAEEQLKEGILYCLGDIVHNGQEVARLEKAGLETIDYDDLRTLKNVRVLLRAHGEPPSTYHIAEDNRIQIIDCTCPVVKHLQEQIHTIFTSEPQAQIVIFGQKGHAEVIGLQGQTNNTALVVENTDDIEAIDLTKDIHLFSQTTKSVEHFQEISAALKERLENTPQAGQLTIHNTICRNVANRVENLKAFARAHEWIVFVGGKKSSNAKVLFQHCLEANPQTLFTDSIEDLKNILASHPEFCKACATYKNQTSQSNPIGICGATSTPQWLMQQVKDYLMEINYSTINN